MMKMILCNLVTVTAEQSNFTYIDFYIIAYISLIVAYYIMAFLCFINIYFVAFYMHFRVCMCVIKSRVDNY